MADELLQYLPEVFRVDPNGEGDTSSAMRDFLRAFERVLIGFDDGDPQLGLEKILDDLSRYFTAGTKKDDGTPDSFLPWLSQWVAMSLRTDSSAEAGMNNETRRRLIANRVRLYRMRGTKSGLEELLGIFTSRKVVIEDQIDGEPHFFRVTLSLDDIKTGDNKAAFDRAKEVVHSVISQEKPAHTRYLLIPLVKTMRIGQRREPPPPQAHVSLPTPYSICVGRSTRLGVTAY